VGGVGVGERIVSWRAVKILLLITDQIFDADKYVTNEDLTPPLL
jgi:hypothetical protein